MSKLYFRYGTMGSSKTANALMTRFNYLERGKNVVLVKPKGENRDGERTIRSRIGIEAECVYPEELPEILAAQRIDAIIVDEAQFLSRDEVDQLGEIADSYGPKGIPVICYGLRTDFRSELFEGAKRLMEIADVIEAIPTICWCGKKAHFNARIVDGKVIKEGPQILLGANDDYVPLCREHFRKGILK